MKLLWKWTFFLRLWRKWIQSDGDYSLNHNFINLNAYTCVEINAHALINILRKLRDSEEPELFLIWLFNSQPCEKFFRTARSLSGVKSTVTNFSIFEFICKILRIDYTGETQLKLKDIVNFPSFRNYTVPLLALVHQHLFCLKITILKMLYSKRSSVL